MSNKAIWLTTIDNPFNPFKDLDSWSIYDIEKEHFSCELLGRMANLSDEMSQAEHDAEIERAINEIIKNDVEHKFIIKYEDK